MFDRKINPTYSKNSWVTAAVAVMLAVSVPVAAESGRVKKRDSAIEFSHDLESALELAKAASKPVYLAFGAEWCPVCRRMNEVTLLEPPMQALADDFIWVAIDIDHNMSLAREWAVEATPTIFLLDASGHSRRKIVGGASAAETSGRFRRHCACFGR